MKGRETASPAGANAAGAGLVVPQPGQWQPPQPSSSGQDWPGWLWLQALALSPQWAVSLSTSPEQQDDWACSVCSSAWLPQAQARFADAVANRLRTRNNVLKRCRIIFRCEGKPESRFYRDVGFSFSFSASKNSVVPLAIAIMQPAGRSNIGSAGGYPTHYILQASAHF